HAREASCRGLHRLQEPLRLSREGPRLPARARPRGGDRLAALYPRYPELSRLGHPRPGRPRHPAESQCPSMAAGSLFLHGLPPPGEETRPGDPWTAEDLGLDPRGRRIAIREAP